MMIWSGPGRAPPPAAPIPDGRGDQRRYMTGCGPIGGRRGGAFSSISAASSSWSRLPQLTPMRTGLSCFARASTICANWRSLLVALPTLPGLMRYFGQRLGAGRKLGQQAVAVVVEVADQRHVDAHAVELLADRGHRWRRRPGVLTVMRTSS